MEIFTKFLHSGLTAIFPQVQYIVYALCVKSGKFVAFDKRVKLGAQSIIREIDNGIASAISDS